MWSLAKHSSLIFGAPCLVVRVRVGAASWDLGEAHESSFGKCGRLIQRYWGLFYVESER